MHKEVYNYLQVDCDKDTYTLYYRVTTKCTCIHIHRHKEVYIKGQKRSKIKYEKCLILLK